MENESRPSPRRGHELQDVSIRFFGNVILGLLLLTLLGMAISLWFEREGLRREAATELEPSPIAVSSKPPPEPRLQVRPADDLTKYRQEEQDRLNRYEWIDQKTGIVRIPIDHAMDLIAERGLPVRSTAAGTKEASSARKEQK